MMPFSILLKYLLQYLNTYDIILSNTIYWMPFSFLTKHSAFDYKHGWSSLLWVNKTKGHILTYFILAEALLSVLKNENEDYNNISMEVNCNG